MDLDTEMLLGTEILGLRIRDLQTGRILGRITGIEKKENSEIFLEDGTYIPREDYPKYEIVNY